MRDIEIAEEAFTKWWNEEKSKMRGFRSEEEKKQYKLALHEGFVKGFFIALDRVGQMLKKHKAGAKNAAN